MDRAPEWAIGIVLVEQMIFAAPQESAVGIIHPITWSNKMIKRPMPVIRERSTQITEAGGVAYASGFSR
jgi:hypothetical protein